MATNLTKTKRLVICVLALSLACLPPSPSSAIANGAGDHDFDFLFGTWRTHIRYKPAEKPWITIDGIVTTNTVWNSKANLEQIEGVTPTGHFEGLTLRLYDPAAKQWNLYWANSKDGIVGPPMEGTFERSRGTFYSHEVIDGVPTFVRQVYYDATSISYKFEQALSYDAGKTWQPNFVASLTRVAPASAIPYANGSDEPTQQHAFDWQFGLWNVHMRRLLHPLTNRATWTNLDGTVKVSKIWNGRANLAEIVAAGPASKLEILALRIYLPQSHAWTLAFAGSSSGQLQPPMYGTFKNGRGTFYDQEDVHRRAVWYRFEFFDATPNAAKDAEALSVDGGKTWVPDFYNVHSRVAPSST